MNFVDSPNSDKSSRIFEAKVYQSVDSSSMRPKQKFSILLSIFAETFTLQNDIDAFEVQSSTDTDNILFEFIGSFLDLLRDKIFDQISNECLSQ